MVEFREGDEISLEVLFEATARTNDSCAGRVETGIHQCAALCVGQPEYALKNKVEADQNLDGCQNVKEYFHAKRA